METCDAMETCEGFLQDLNIQYDFDPDDTIRKAVHDQLTKWHPMLEYVRSVYVQRWFQLSYKQTHSGVYLPVASCCYAPAAIPPFQIEGDDSFFYLITYSKGIPFDPTEDKDGRTLYEYSDQGQKMFLSKIYKKIIKDIFAAVLHFIRFVPRTRCVIQLNTLYIDEHLNEYLYQIENYDTSDPDLYTEWMLPDVHFMKYSMLDEGKQDDIATVCQQLRDLFHEINTKSNIDGAPKQEFQLFMDSLELQYGCVRNIYKNVVFASEAHRVKLMDCFGKHFSSTKGNRDNLVTDAFGKKWKSNLKRNPKLKIFFPEEDELDKDETEEDEPGEDEGDSLRRVRQRLMNDDITPCISAIKKLYISYEHKRRQYSAEINSLEQLVGIVHCIFPNHIAALSIKAREEGMTFPEFEPWDIDDRMDESPNEICDYGSFPSTNFASQSDISGSPLPLLMAMDAVIKEWRDRNAIWRDRLAFFEQQAQTM